MYIIIIIIIMVVIWLLHSLKLYIYLFLYCCGVLPVWYECDISMNNELSNKSGQRLFIEGNVIILFVCVWGGGGGVLCGRARARVCVCVRWWVFFRWCSTPMAAPLFFSRKTAWCRNLHWVTRWQIKLYIIRNWVYSGHNIGCFLSNPV